MSEDSEKKPQVQAGTMGTFAGVFTPSFLTILGIILFMRLGYVVGSAGLMKALSIIALASAISVITTLSLSAVSTNMRVRGGGVYYLISRTLGVEFGGAIGVVLFLAQSVSIGFYCIGFGEVISLMMPVQYAHMPQIVAALAAGLLFCFAWLGADWATKFQYVVMAVLVSSLVSFYIGGWHAWDPANIASNMSGAASGPEFWILFAIFFPAVTGFTQGVNMSGDLKDPGRSIPVGTFAAVGLSIAVYFSTAVIMAGALPRTVLTDDYSSMKQASAIGMLVDAGVIAATLSSAMASFLGAPRILQSMANDRIFPFLRFFAKGYGPANNPRRGVILSALIAFMTISLGELNAIAPVVSMFFLVSYGLLNYATYYEAHAASPSFRPRFRWFNKNTSLAGAVACLIVMLGIDLMAAAISVAVLFALYQYLRRVDIPDRWADSKRSYHLQQVRAHLLAAASEIEHPRDWRPQIIAFSDESRRRERLLHFCSWIEGGSGMTTVVRILEGAGVKMLKERSEAEQEMRRELAAAGLMMFPLAVVSPDSADAVQVLVQSFGVGPLKVNTVVANWLDQGPSWVLSLKEKHYSLYLRTAFRLGCNIVILDAGEEEWEALEKKRSGRRRIDVWWTGDATSRLMLLLAYLMTRSAPWADAKIRMLAMVSGVHAEASAAGPCGEGTRAGKDTGAPVDRTSGEQSSSGPDATMECLYGMLEEVRIEAEVQIMPDATEKDMANASSDASVVFMPFRIREGEILTLGGSKIESLLGGLGITAMVMAAEDIGLEAEPEEGTQAEMARMRDTLEKARRRARRARQDVLDAGKEAERLRSELDREAASGSDDEALDKLRAALVQAQELLDQAVRKSAKAEAKEKDAAQDAQEHGIDQ
ncbi:MAG: amino acid permease [Bacteriovoracaceae bacterium]|nr:amino acid permease [Bacteriovoracaceae bacterium]